MNLVVWSTLMVLSWDDMKTQWWDVWRSFGWRAELISSAEGEQRKSVETLHGRWGVSTLTISEYSCSFKYTVNNTAYESTQNALTAAQYKLYASQSRVWVNPGNPNDAMLFRDITPPMVYDHPKQV